MGARRAMGVFDETAVVVAIASVFGGKREGRCGMGGLV